MDHDPDVQLRHTLADDAPTLVENVPALHCVHDSDCADAHVPATHDTHAMIVDDTFTAVPGPHEIQPNDPGGDVLPDAHNIHTAADVPSPAGANVPALHRLQLPAPIVDHVPG